MARDGGVEVWKKQGARCTSEILVGIPKHDHFSSMKVTSVTDFRLQAPGIGEALPFRRIMLAGQAQRG